MKNILNILVFDTDKDAEVHFSSVMSSFIKGSAGFVVAKTLEVFKQHCEDLKPFNVLLINFHTKSFWNMGGSQTRNFVEELQQKLPANCAFIGITGDIPQYNALTATGITVVSKGYYSPHLAISLGLVSKNIFFKRNFSIASVQKQVATAFDISIEEIIVKTRTHSITEIRQVAEYLCTLLTKSSLKDIAEAFGHKREHTTVLSSVRKVQGLIQIDEDFRKKVLAIKDKIQLEEKELETP